MISRIIASMGLGWGMGTNIGDAVISGKTGDAIIACIAVGLFVLYCVVLFIERD